MISHVTLGSNHLKKAECFYTHLLVLIGSSPVYISDSVVFYEFLGCSTKLAITIPYNEQPATSGNGVMLALKLESMELVQDVYLKAIELGATCEGEPGPRNDNSYFGAYFRDLDGNKIAIFFRD